MTIQECNVYWHRTWPSDHWTVWIVGPDKLTLIKQGSEPYLPQYKHGNGIYAKGTYYTVREAKCMYWPNYRDWAAKQAKASKVYSWEDNVNRGVEVLVTGEDLETIRQELAAADEIEEALTLRISELRAENKELRTERDRAESNLSALQALACREGRAESKRTAQALKERDEARLERNKVKSDLQVLQGQHRTLERLLEVQREQIRKWNDVANGWQNQAEDQAAFNILCNDLEGIKHALRELTRCDPVNFCLCVERLTRAIEESGRESVIRKGKQS